MNAPHLLLVLAVALSSSHCGALQARKTPADPNAEVESLLGESLRDLPIPAEAMAAHRLAYDEAKAQLAREPNDANALIALGRRAGAMGLVREAIAVFERGAAQFPHDPRMVRHLGHRYITARRFEDAEDTLERAAAMVQGQPDEPEPGLMPNAQGVVIDTLQQNVFYHLALARHLRGDFDGAVAAWRECMERSNNPDSSSSCTNWLCASLLRAGRADEARDALRAITADLPIVEYHAYFALCRVYQGELDGDRVLLEAQAKGAASTDYATIAYGVGNWHFVNGRHERALAVWGEAARAPMWAAFGRIGSEVEIARGADL
ncbi:MAG: hypothetical protein IT459_13505 [Planctomycetes bacterium]|nr:hypothetical protein [Planctomycetota bacterium]